MHHVDLDACFHRFTYDREELAPCLPFNRVLMDVLASVRRGIEGGRGVIGGGWIRTKIDSILYCFPESPSEEFCLELGAWARTEWLLCGYTWILMPELVIDTLNGYGKWHSHRKMVIDLAFFSSVRRWSRRWNDCVERRAKRILLHLTDQLSDLGEVVPTMVLYLPNEWQGWRTLWPGVAVEERTSDDNEKISVFRLSTPGDDTTPSTQQLEVEICHRVQKIRATSLFWGFQDGSENSSVCKMTLRVTSIHD